MGDLNPRLIHGSLGQTACQSVQPFLHSSLQSVPMLCHGSAFTLKIARSHGGSGSPFNTWLSVSKSTTQIASQLDMSFLANVNSRSRSLYAIARPSVCRLSVCRLSVVCNVRAPYSGGWNFRQYFYGIRYLGHPLTSTKNFMEIVPGEPLRRGKLNTRGVVKYSDFGPIDGYISETVQDRR